jgi:hypothetical protein
MDKILKTQGKHEIVIVLLIAVPLMIGGVVWAILEGGYAEPLALVTPVATPASPTATPSAFVIQPDA